jgi:hypothetical protein
VCLPEAGTPQSGLRAGYAQSRGWGTRACTQCAPHLHEHALAGVELVSVSRLEGHERLETRGIYTTLSAEPSLEPWPTLSTTLWSIEKTAASLAEPWSVL